VWIAGPLSGLIMQPIVGVLADRSRSKWGRRRPFMVGGAVIVGLCLLVLGWTKEIVGVFVTEPSAVGPLGVLGSNVRHALTGRSLEEECDYSPCGAEHLRR